MDDREKVQVVKTLLSVLQSREAFIVTCRWRAKEWSRLVWFYYSLVERDDPLAAAILVAPYRKSRKLSDRQELWLKGFDQWFQTWPLSPKQDSDSSTLKT